MGIVIKIAIVAGLCYWLSQRGRVFLAKFWLAFVAPKVEKVNGAAGEVIVASTSAEESPLSAEQVEELRK